MMVKVKEEVWVERCDFCESAKEYTCTLCGLDICAEHAYILRKEKYTHPKGYMVWGYDYTTKLVDHFCPNHLSPELRGLTSSPIYTINTTDGKPNKEETTLSDA